MSRRAMMVAPGAGGGGGSSFKTITIPAAKLGSTNIAAGFTATLAGTFSYLKDIAHGGSLTSVNQVAFYDDSGLTTLSGFEREKHDLTTGAVVYHFKSAATLSHTVDAIAGYMRINEPGGDLSSPSGTWRATVKRRWGFGDGSTLSLADSTGNGTALTNVGSVTAAAGPVNGAASFPGTSGYLVESTPAAAISSYPATFTCWAKSSASAEQVLLAVVRKSTSIDEFWSSINYGTGKLRSIQQAAGNGARIDHPLTSNSSAWHFFANVFNTIDNAAGYEDGSALSLTVHANSTPSGLDNTYIGAFQYLTTNLYQPMNGQIAEARIYSEALSASEVMAMYNNFNDPATFCVVT